MKTTIDIPVGLLRRTEEAAARRRTTLDVVVAEALRGSLDAADSGARPVRLRLHTFRGKGLQPGLSWGDWNSIRSLAYERR